MNRRKGTKGAPSKRACSRPPRSPANHLSTGRGEAAPHWPPKQVHLKLYWSEADTFSLGNKCLSFSNIPPSKDFNKAPTCSTRSTIHFCFPLFFLQTNTKQNAGEGDETQLDADLGTLILPNPEEFQNITLGNVTLFKIKYLGAAFQV